MGKEKILSLFVICIQKNKTFSKKCLTMCKNQGMIGTRFEVGVVWFMSSFQEGPLAQPGDESLVKAYRQGDNASLVFLISRYLGLIDRKLDHYIGWSS